MAIKTTYKQLIICTIFFSLTACNNTPTSDNSDLTSEQMTEVVYEYGIPVDSFNTTEGNVKAGETLSAILGKLGCKGQVIHQLNYFSSDTFDVKRIKQGDSYTAYYSKDSIPELTYVVYHQSVVDHIVFHVCDTLCAHRFKKTVRTEQRIAHAVISTSLWDAIISNNLHRQLALDLSGIYAWSIDFFGLQKNDSFVVLYDELFVDTLSIGIENTRCNIHSSWENFLRLLF